MRTAPSFFVGGDASQIERINELVAESLAERPRRLVILLTHSHLDHYGGVEGLRTGGQRPLTLAHHYAAEGEGVSDLAVVAARKALDSANVPPSEIDYVIFATMTPEHAFPGSGALLGAKLGIPGVPALDIRQQCAAMPFGMQLADGLVASGAARTVLLVGAEAHAGFMPYAWDVLLGESERQPTPEEYDFATRHRGTASPLIFLR